MRKMVCCFGIAMLVSLATAQSASAPQTARQALMEMFFSKAPGTFVKHLPAVTRTALEKSGAMTTLAQYSQMASQFPTDGQNLQTFETGPILLEGQNPKTGDKVQITVESDRLRGDQDDIAIALHIFKNGQPQLTPFMPQMTFSMKQESQTWKLNEISVTIHVPLTDPDLLKAIEEKMAPQPGAHVTLASQSGMPMSAPHPETPAQTGGSDAQVIAAMKTILAAEATYASRYSNIGYTCSLSSLDGFGGGEPNEHQAMLISSSLAGGKRYGFGFVLTDCTGAPASSFHLTAAPSSNVFGRKTFCSDQSGVIRSGEDAASCIASGLPVQ